MFKLIGRKINVKFFYDLENDLISRVVKLSYSNFIYCRIKNDFLKSYMKYKNKNLYQGG